jgi:hypothetical protein
MLKYILFILYLFISPMYILQIYATHIPPPHPITIWSPHDENPFPSRLRYPHMSCGNPITISLYVMRKSDYDMVPTSPGNPSSHPTTPSPTHDPNPFPILPFIPEHKKGPQKGSPRKTTYSVSYLTKY